MSLTPKRGDLIWLDFDPQAGHEQAKRRPALVLSAAGYNQASGLMLCCPISSQVKGYPFEVAVNGKVKGVVLSDQVKSLDWRARHAERIGRAEAEVIDEVLAKVAALLEIDQ